MAIPLKYNTASQEFTFGQALDNTDGDTEEGALTIANTDIKLHKAGTITLASKNSGGATYISNGVYYGTFDATDTNTYGPMTMYIHVAGALAMKVEFEVMNAVAYDALYGTDNFDVSVTQLGGVTQSADDLKDFADAGYDPATNKVQGVVLVDTNTDMRGTDSAALASALTTAQTDLDTITGIDGVTLATLQALYAPSKAGDDMGLTAVATSAQLITDIFNEVLDKATYNVGQSLGKLIRELGAWNAADGVISGTPTTTNITTNITGYDDNFFRDQRFWAYNGAALAGQSRVVSTYNGTTGVFTFDEPFTSAHNSGDDVLVSAPHVHRISEISESVRTEMDSNSTQLAAIVADTNELQTDDIPGLIAALNDPTAAAVAAAVAAYDMGNGRTIEEALAFLRNKWEIIGGTLTVYDTDDTTILWTSVMTQTAGDPVSASDPT